MPVNLNDRIYKVYKPLGYTKKQFEREMIKESIKEEERLRQYAAIAKLFEICMQEDERFKKIVINKINEIEKGIESESSNPKYKEYIERHKEEHKYFIDVILKIKSFGKIK